MSSTLINKIMKIVNTDIIHSADLHDLDLRYCEIFEVMNFDDEDKSPKFLVQISLYFQGMFRGETHTIYTSENEIRAAIRELTNNSYKYESLFALAYGKEELILNWFNHELKSELRQIQRQTKKEKGNINPLNYVTL